MHQYQLQQHHSLLQLEVCPSCYKIVDKLLHDISMFAGVYCCSRHCKMWMWLNSDGLAGMLFRYILKDLVTQASHRIEAEGIIDQNQKVSLKPL